MELVYLSRNPYGGPQWKEALAKGNLDACFAGVTVKVRQEGEIDGRPRFVCNVPDRLCGDCNHYHMPADHTVPHDWYPTGLATEMMVEAAARAAIDTNAQEEQRRQRQQRDEGLIEIELIRVGEEMGLIDRDVLHMALTFGRPSVTETADGPVVVGVRETLEAFRNAKPHFFKATVDFPRAGATARAKPEMKGPPVAA